MKCLVIVFIVVSFSQISFGQNNIDSTWHHEFGFINHWISIEEFDDAIYVIDKLNRDDLSSALLDSLSYLKAWSYYLMKDLDSSIKYFDKVSLESSAYYKSLFFSAFNESYLGRPINGLRKLSVSRIDSSYIALQNFEKAGMYLLERDTTAFLNLAKKFDGSSYPFSKEEANLMDYYYRINNYKEKSMFLAGAMSAIMPGSGKVYAGRLGDGISSFLLTSSIAFVAIENISKDGFLDPKSLFFTGLFSVFYIGNIWGSVFSVQMQTQEFNDEINHNILFDLHIPLRRIFY